MLLLRPQMHYLLCAMLAIALLVAAIWLGMFARARRVVAQADRHVLRLDPDALVLIEGSREERVAWHDVVAISTDEERLVVRVEAREGRVLEVEPRYGGLGVTDLEHAVRKAFDAAETPSPP